MASPGEFYLLLMVRRPAPATARRFLSRGREIEAPAASQPISVSQPEIGQNLRPPRRFTVLHMCMEHVPVLTVSGRAAARFGFASRVSADARAEAWDLGLGTTRTRSLAVVSSLSTEQLIHPVLGAAHERRQQRCDSDCDCDRDGARDSSTSISNQ